MISIIIANFNGEEYLETCLASVLDQTHKNFEVIITDDGSDDKSIEIINRFAKKSKKIKLFKNKTNLGASASRNKAIKKARGDILVFLDNDTEVTKTWLEKLIKPLRKEDVGAAQSVLLDFHKRKLIQNVGGKYMRQTGWLIPLYQWKEYEKVKSKIKDMQIGAISASLAIKKEVLDEVGLFDELEAVTTEDIDLVWRIWLSGKKVQLAYDSVCYHWTKDISQRQNLKVDYENIYFNLCKNSIRSIIKNYEFLNILRYLPQTILINIGRGLYEFFGMDFSSLKGALRGLTWNIIAFKDTMQERREIQKYRKVTDKEMGVIFANENLLDIIKMKT